MPTKARPRSCSCAEGGTRPPFSPWHTWVLVRSPSAAYRLVACPLRIPLLHCMESRHEWVGRGDEAHSFVRVRSWMKARVARLARATHTPPRTNAQLGSGSLCLMATHVVRKVVERARTDAVGVEGAADGGVAGAAVCLRHRPAQDQDAAVKLDLQ